MKSHTAEIEQLLEDFNDDQMVFRLEAESLEQERLATIPTSPPTAIEQMEDPPHEEITVTAQEELAPATGHSEDAHSEPHPVEETVSPPDIAPPTDTTVAPEEDARADMITPDQTLPSAPTVQPDHPDTTPDPANILDILEEE